MKGLAPLVLAAAIALNVVACDGGGGGSGSRPTETDAESDPFTSVHAQLADLPARDLFEVEADRAQYWRMFTLDRYDGKSWTRTDPDGSAGGVHVLAPAIPTRSGDMLPPEAETLSQTFRILGDLEGERALPMAYRAVEVAGPIGDITWDPARGEASIDGDLAAGTTYFVRSRIVVPTPQELDRVVFPPPERYGVWTELPGDLDPRIGAIAERWTAGATSDYQKVLAIQQHFQDGRFVYSTDVEPADDADALFEFLTRTRAGFCQHYSSAMTVMVRALGLPARIAVGYRAGTPQADGSYLVRTTDAHVWVEVFFPGYGWLPFEPEPGTSHPDARVGTYLNPIPSTVGA